MVAVVVSNDQPDILRQTLEGLSKQSFRLDRTLVVDSSTGTDVDKVLSHFEEISERNAVLKISAKANFAELAAAGIKQVLSGLESLDQVSIWLLHDDTVPEQHSLAELVRALEISPLVAIASPKQVSFDNPRIIVQQGLTVTKSLRPFSMVTNEFDQKQYDSMSDVLAVSSNAMLIRATSWADLGGFSLNAPELAADIDLGVRAHLSGSRVVVVPTARVRHAQLTLSGQRSKKWLGGSPKYGIAKATNHLRLVNLQLFQALLFWLALPLYSIAQIFWLLLVKRPDRIMYSLKANTWAFFTVLARLRDRHGRSLNQLKALIATSDQVRAKSRIAFEVAEQKLKLESFSTQTSASIGQVGFIASGGLWWSLLLLAISYRFIPLGESAIGGYALPLSSEWLKLFSHAGSSFQSIGNGFVAPSDPFNWVLLLVGSITFWSPNLALSFLLLFAKALAFMGAWRLLSLVTQKTGIRTIFALAYALWPAFTNSQNVGNFPDVIYAIALPWFIFTLGRAAKLGLTSSIRSAEQTWSWIAASGLLLAVVIASGPSELIPLFMIGLLTAIIARKRIATLIIIGLPAATIVLPYYLFQLLSNRSWLGVLASPTISVPNSRQTILQAITGHDELLGWAAVGIIALSLLALLAKARGVGSAWLIAIVALANLWFIQSLSFRAGGVGAVFLEPTKWVYDSSAPSAMLAGLACIAALALWLESLNRSWIRKTLVSLVMILACLPLGASSVLLPTEVSFAESRNLPAIVTAEAKAGSDLKLLVINSSGTHDFRAEVIWPSGGKLDSISTAYRLASAGNEQRAFGKDGISLSTTIANLASANGKDPSKALQQAKIGFILVPDTAGNGELGLALNSVAQLEPVGITEFGQLWRVKSAVGGKSAKASLWSITKGIQATVLLGFILLALPTSRGRKDRKAEALSDLDVEGVEQ